MWYSKLSRFEILEHIYNDVPELIDISIYSIDIVSTENKISILFKMPTLPSPMPVKWEKRNCNMVLCQLDFWDIELCTFQLNSMHGKSNIIIEDDELFKIKIEGNFNVNFHAKYGMVQKVRAYKKEVNSSIL